MFKKLIQNNVRIPCPEAIVLEDIDPEKIQSGTILYPGTVIKGQSTFIGKDSVIGAGGGAYIENVQIGQNCTLMQGVYRDCTFLDHVTIRNGAEIREGCLLEEHAELGHTCGLKQTIFFPNVVAGSLINFCDALISGGTSRKDHSEIGSCMALYNFTPQGDKFASLFGDVEHGLFLKEKPIFIGGQTQIVSPVKIGFGSVLAAGSKLTQSIEENTLVSTADQSIKKQFDCTEIHRPDIKIQITLEYIQNLRLLAQWYQNIRIPLYQGTSSEYLMQSALGRIQSGILEREKRLQKFIDKLPASLELHRKYHHENEIRSHETALSICHNSTEPTVQFDYPKILSEMKIYIHEGLSYIDSVKKLSVM